MSVISINLAPDQVFDTVASPPCDYGTTQVTQFEKLRQKAIWAFKEQDLNTLGEIATESAQINQGYYPNARFEELMGIVDRHPIAGVQLAHSGTLAGVMMAPDALPVFALYQALEAAGFCLRGIFHISPSLTQASHRRGTAAVYPLQYLDTSGGASCHI